MGWVGAQPAPPRTRPPAVEERQRTDATVPWPTPAAASAEARAAAVARKEEGNRLFGQGKLRDAVRLYSEAVELDGADFTCEGGVVGVGVGGRGWGAMGGWEARCPTTHTPPQPRSPHHPRTLPRPPGPRPRLRRFYGNRAACLLQLDEYAHALKDAVTARCGRWEGGAGARRGMRGL